MSRTCRHIPESVQPKLRKRRVPRALTPELMERVRKAMLERKAVNETAPLRDATLVSVMYQAGLRPGEALFLRWEHIRERTILVEGALAFGEDKGTKTEEARTVPMTPTLAEDLAAWRLACGNPADSEYVFPARDGLGWEDHDWRNWRRRVWKPAVQAVAKDPRRAHLGKATPYWCRHTTASGRLRAGDDLARLARMMGHSILMLMRHYAHVIDELEGVEPVPFEQQVAEARALVFGRDQGDDQLPLAA